MPSTKDFNVLREQLLARPGAAELLAEARKETLAEIGLYELRKRLEWSQDSLAERLGVSQAAVSQLERAEDMSVSRLRRYLRQLGAELQLVAVFDDGNEETSVEIRVGAAAEPGDPAEPSAAPAPTLG